ncbi:MAG: hypothetical protein P8X93_05340, partial [Gammaproteobacteria bacterium]
EGSNPSIRDKPYTPLAGERLQPLGHLSDIIGFVSLTFPVYSGAISMHQFLFIKKETLNSILPAP